MRSAGSSPVGMWRMRALLSGPGAFGFGFGSVSSLGLLTRQARRQTRS